MRSIRASVTGCALVSVYFIVAICCFGKEADYATLKTALCEERFEEVITSVEGRMHEGQADYEHVRLRARATGEAYRAYYWANSLGGKRPSDSQIVALEALAIRCTCAYEDAIKAARSPFERAQVCSEWWRYRLHGRFSQDSELIRRTVLRDRAQPSARKAQKAQFDSFQKAFLAALDTDARTVQWVGDNKEEFADCTAREFELLTWMEIPEERWSRIVSDLPGFVGKLLPPAGMISDPEQYRLTIRWYLWNAIVCELPDEVERARIDAQVEGFAETLRRQLDEAMADPNIEREGVARATEFLNAYEAVKDNIYCPYFKRVFFSCDTSLASSHLGQSLDQLSRSWERRVREFAEIEDWQERKTLCEEVWRSVVYPVRHEVFYAAVSSSLPTLFGRMPFEWIQKSSGRLNDEGYYVFAVTKATSYEGSDLEKTHLWAAQEVANIKSRQNVSAQ